MPKKTKQVSYIEFKKLLNNLIKLHDEVSMDDLEDEFEYIITNIITADSEHVIEHFTGTYDDNNVMGFILFDEGEIKYYFNKQSCLV